MSAGLSAKGCADVLQSSITYWYVRVLILHGCLEALHLGAKSKGCGHFLSRVFFSERGVLWITDFSGGKLWHVFSKFWTWMNTIGCSLARTVVGLVPRSLLGLTDYGYFFFFFFSFSLVWQQSFLFLDGEF